MRVLIVDDNAIVREGLVLWLSSAADIEVVGEAATGGEGVLMAAGLEPDLVLMDISLPDISGVEATRRILAGGRGQPGIVCISMHLERRHPVEAFAAGARGYVVKSGLAEELIPAMRTVAAGGRHVSPRLDAALVAELAGDG